MAVSSKKAPKSKLKKAGTTSKAGAGGKKRATRKTGTAKSKSSSKRESGVGTVTVDRRRSDSRRSTTDRRTEEKTVTPERRKLQRRASVPRRRQIDPTTCERDYTEEEIEFMNALDEYKRKSGRMFPTCSEILEVVKDLGYAKPSAAPVPIEPAPIDTAAPDTLPVSPV